jgi:hypothetical protein
MESHLNEKATDKTHWSFWLISIFMLIWNVMGCINFFMQMDPEMVSSYRETEQVIIQGRPLWVTAGFAIAVFGGVLGCILLLLKRFVSFYIFVASLLGVLIAIGHSLTLNIEFSTGEIIGIVLMPVLVAAFLVWYSKYVKSKGWLNVT